MDKIQENDVVVLEHALPNFGLLPGDLGTVVHCYHGSQQVEVEFLKASGETVGVVTLSLREVRRRKPSEILHVRDMAA